MGNILRCDGVSEGNGRAGDGFPALALSCGRARKKAAEIQREIAEVAGINACVFGDSGRGGVLDLL
jgi:hypothetical protein